MRLIIGVLLTITTLSCIHSAYVPHVLPKDPAIEPQLEGKSEPTCKPPPSVQTKSEAESTRAPSAEPKSGSEQKLESATNAENHVEPKQEPEPKLDTDSNQTPTTKLDASNEQEPEPELALKPKIDSEPKPKADANSEAPPALKVPCSSATAATSTDSTQDVCLTKGCVKAASSMIEKMNPTANPCEDFYEFSCGSFVKNHHIPEDKPELNAHSLIDDKLMGKLRTIVEEAVKPEDSIPTKMVKDLYSSCMNTTAREKAGLKPLQEIHARMGGWPVVVGSTWDPATFNWMQAGYTNRKEGFDVGYFLYLWVIPDIKNTTRRIISFEEAFTGLSHEYLLKGLSDSTVAAYLQYSIDVAVLFGADPVKAEAEMTDVMNFQVELAKISTSREERRNWTYSHNVYTLKELESRIPDIPFVEYVNTILKPDVPIKGTEEVIVASITFLENLNSLLKATPPRTLANYMLWRVTDEVVEFLTDEIRDMNLEYLKKLKGMSKRLPKWRECLNYVSSRFSYALSNLYVTNFFDEEAKWQAIETFDYIKREFSKVLENVDWMDPTTKAQAMTKVDYMKAKIGYPSELKMVDKLMEYYGDLKVDDKGFFENRLRITVFEEDSSFGKLRTPLDKTDWKRNGIVAIFIASQSLIENSIKISAGALQEPFFEPDRPKYMNFGAIGYIIGYQITLGFDDQGKQFDAMGNLRNWWQKETEEKFSQKAQCIIKQYGGYKTPENGMLVNGINTQGQNIADNGGIKLAYRAYQAWLKDNPKEKRLPGLMEYSRNQLFWISAAQIWCSKYRNESLKHIILTGDSSPERFRVQGPFSNFHEFARDWNCPTGSPMNPKKKCFVW